MHYVRGAYREGAGEPQRRCVGCGLCQTRCYGINVLDKGLLKESAVIIRAGEGKEDRLMSGSYIALREAEATAKEQQHQKLRNGSGDGYLPDFLK